MRSLPEGGYLKSIKAKEACRITKPATSQVLPLHVDLGAAVSLMLLLCDMFHLRLARFL